LMREKQGMGPRLCLRITAALVGEKIIKSEGSTGAEEDCKMEAGTGFAKVSLFLLNLTKKKESSMRHGGGGGEREGKGPCRKIGTEKLAGTMKRKRNDLVGKGGGSPAPQKCGGDVGVQLRGAGEKKWIKTGERKDRGQP